MDTRRVETRGGCSRSRVPRLSTFLVYATWAAFQGDHYTYGPYLSPFYSPEIFGTSPHSWFGPKPASWPAWLPFSPALLILPIPAFFRLTCYYYRGAYYKAFWADPPSCTVGEPRSSYWGENSFPLVLQNIHRYMLFISVAVLIILAVDVWKALWFPIRLPARVVRHRRRHTRSGRNIVLLSGYLFGCHSLRHVVGRMRRSALARAARRACLLVRELPQPAAHGVGVEQSFQGGLR